jgi:glucokinase
MIATVDIGGTKVLIAVFDNDKIVKQIKFPTPKDYNDFKIVLAENVAKLSTKSFSKVVAAAPGKINRPTGVVEAFGNLDWRDVPIREDIESVFGMSVHLENDAKLAALSEGLLVYPAFRKSLYVTISTGIGGGLVIDGRLDPDFLDIELGQMLFEYEGRLRDWEDFGSGRAFQEKFGHRVSETQPSDNAAWYWFSRNIAIGLTNLAATLTPEIIIIGGGAGAHLDKFKHRLDEQIKLYTNPMFIMPPIQKAQRPEEAVIYGCNDYAKQLK